MRNHDRKVSPRMLGILMVLMAGTSWGVAGTVAQYLFQQQNFSPEWLVVVRLLVSGLLLLCVTSLRSKRSIWEIWRSKYDVISLLIFSILGMMTVQYTYFAAIQHSNAATATVLQYLAPVIVAMFIVFRMKKVPSKLEILALGFALVGTFLLVTKGNLTSLSISRLALFWGLLSAFSLAFYTLHPMQLLSRWGSGIVVGWGMVIGGAAFSFIHPPWKFVGEWTFSSALGVVFIILFGTLIAFYLYLESLTYISAAETSLLACVEPLSAAVVSVIWLKVTFGFSEWLGTILILSTVLILTLSKKKIVIEST